MEVDSNGDVSLYFNGVNNRFDVVDNQGLDITSGGLGLVGKHDPDGPVGFVLSRNAGSFGSVQYGLRFAVSTNTDFINSGISRVNDGNNELKTKISVITYDGLSSKIYLDGVVRNLEIQTFTLQSTTNIQIGCRSGSENGIIKAIFYLGHISDTIVFNRALTQAEAAKLNRL